ncbi:hypothetical protein Tco_0204565 [Tanacetum coccineum]
MNDEVDQNTIDKQCAKIVKKNLLIENENLIPNYLSNQLLYDVEKSRCLDLEAEMSKVHNESKHISKLQRGLPKLQFKVSTSSRFFDNNKSLTSLEQFESFHLEVCQKQKVLDLVMYAIDVEPIPPRLKNNKSAHLTYINHLKESVEIVREIVEEARVVKPLDNTLNYACQYTKLSQELVEYVIGTCPKEFTKKDNKVAAFIPLTRKKQSDSFSGGKQFTRASGLKPKKKYKSTIDPGQLRVEADWETKMANADKQFEQEKQIWKPKGKLSDNLFEKDQGRLFKTYDGKSLMAPVRISSGPEPNMMFGQNSSSLFKPRSSLSNDVWTKQFKPRSSSNDVYSKKFWPRSSIIFTKMVRETLSHADAESGGNSEKINSETDTEILNVSDEQAKELQSSDSLWILYITQLLLKLSLLQDIPF